MDMNLSELNIREQPTFIYMCVYTIWELEKSDFKYFNLFIFKSILSFTIYVFFFFHFHTMWWQQPYHETKKIKIQTKEKMEKKNWIL